MKFISVIAFCVLMSSAFGNSSYAGKYADEAVQQTPKPASTPTSTSYVAPASAHDEKCWMETKKCCWVQKKDGYECRDNYDTKVARCYRKYKFHKKCNKAKKDGQVKKPEAKVEYRKCQKVHYDPNYGLHVAGYPSGMSDPYHSKELPKTPYQVEAKPHPPYATQAPTTYEQNNRNIANNGYQTQVPAREY